MSRLIQTGSYLPGAPIDNQQLIQHYQLDSTDEWIQQRTGIKTRYFAQDESIADLAVKAARACLQQGPADVIAQLQGIFVASMSGAGLTPAVANQVQAALCADQAWACDVNAACSGFVAALELANAWSSSRQTGYSLVIGVEKMSSILDFTDRSTCVLFGDGAGAVLIAHDGEGLPDFASQLQSLPDPHQCIHCDPWAGQQLSMAGREVFNFVNRTVVPSLHAFIQVLGPYDYLIMHQANERFTDIFHKKGGIPYEKMVMTIEATANTSAASIPIVLDRCVRQGQVCLDGSQAVVLTGFGGGLTLGHQYFKV